jgi:hypothetical protein
MGNFVKAISYRERELLYVDCSNQSEANILKAFDEMLEAVFASVEPQKCLVLFNMANSPSSLSINNKGREVVEKASARGVPELPTAIFGFSGAQKLVARMFVSLRRDDTLFIADTEEHAKDWLIAKAK